MKECPSTAKYMMDEAEECQGGKAKAIAAFQVEG
jgi:hypothetical protein